VYGVSIVIQVWKVSFFVQPDLVPYFNSMLCKKS